MTVISQQIDRGDILIHRASDETYCVRWTEDKRDGNGYVPKDLTMWTAEFEMLLDDSIIFTVPCTTDSYGYVIAKIEADTFTGTFWKTREKGSWRIRAYGPSHETEILAWGYYRIV